MKIFSHARKHWRQLLLAGVALFLISSILQGDTSAKYFADYSPWFPEQRNNPEILTWNDLPVLDLDKVRIHDGNTQFAEAKFSNWLEKWQARMLMGAALYNNYSEMRAQGVQIARPIVVEECHQSLVDQRYLVPFVRRGQVFAYVWLSHYGWDITAVPVDTESLDHPKSSSDSFFNFSLQDATILDKSKAWRILKRYPSLNGHLIGIQRVFLRAQIGSYLDQKHQVRQLGNFLWRVNTDKGMLILDLSGQLFRPSSSRPGFYKYSKRYRDKEIKAASYGWSNKLPGGAWLHVEPFEPGPHVSHQ